MEGQTFILPAVAEKLENHFVEARLHGDTHEEFAEFAQKLVQSVAQPIYAIVPADSDLNFQSESFDPTKVKILSRLDGALAGQFEDFLQKGMDAQ
jgi:hypothetical protein